MLNNSSLNLLLKPKKAKILKKFTHKFPIFYSTTTTTSQSPPITVALLEYNLFTQCRSLKQAKSQHQQILVRGLFEKTAAHIINLYTIYESSHNHALKVLKSLNPSPEKVYWWNQIIRFHIRNGGFQTALGCFSDMQRFGWRPDGYTYPFVLKACGEIRSVRYGRLIHGVVCCNGVESNVFVCNGLVAMYGRCGNLRCAQQVFDEMFSGGICDGISWNSIVATYVQNGEAKRAIEIFYRMNNGGELRADAVSLVNILPACGLVGELKLGKEVHGYAIRSSLADDVFVGNSVVDMYAKCEKMDEASVVFTQMNVRDVVSWNVMVTGYSQVGRYDDALSLFERMRVENIELNVVTWSAVIAGYAQRGYGRKALDVFREMQVSGSKPNAVTLISLLSACASVGALVHGKETHSYAIKSMLNINGNDLEDDMRIINGLIDMYAKCKGTHFAHTLFEGIAPKRRDVVTWTVMIGGYAQHGEANDALDLFSKMLKPGYSLTPNDFTISCALMACARLGALRLGKEIHGHVLRNRYDHAMLFVANCLIDMYSKSGDVDAARTVFDNMHQRNAVSWTSLMNGYGMHGRGDDVLYTFNEMRKTGFVPDGVTILVLLYACSHSGMSDKGIDFFNNMSEKFNVTPRIEHYACMVDLLGRSGRLNEAMKLIKDMPMEPRPIIWFTLLSACRTHANVELGEFAANQLLDLGSENDGSYTLLSNIYANARRWKDVARIRLLMKHTGIRKRPGCSWVQSKKGSETFFVGDKSHAMSQQIYELLYDLMERIKPLGYVPETSFALHDVDDEEKGDLLLEHSEKLALAYGILTAPSGSTLIRITKNLRICGDCHSAITYISMIVEHEIILRDSSRFHHFKNGVCSCKGYW